MPSKQRQIMRSKQGLLFWADPASGFGFELLREKVCEPQMTKLFEVVLRPSDTLLDVGGGEGYFSILGSRLALKGWVHCIEPQTRMQTVILENIRLNACSNIIVHPVALLESRRKIKLYLRPSTNPLASGVFRTGKVGYASEVVDSTTLDLLFEEHKVKHVRLMKIDCEGAEYFVIEGGKQVLSQKKITFIAMEYHPTLGPQAPQRCVKTHAQLISHGYVLTKINGQTIYHLPGLHDILKPLGNVLVNCKLEE